MQELCDKVLAMLAPSSFDILCGRGNNANGSGRSCTDSY